MYVFKKSGYKEILYTVILAVCIVIRCRDTHHDRVLSEILRHHTLAGYSRVALHVTCLLESNVTRNETRNFS